MNYFEVYKYDIGNDREKESIAIVSSEIKALAIQNALQAGENYLSPYDYRVRPIDFKQNLV